MTKANPIVPKAKRNFEQPKYGPCGELVSSEEYARLQALFKPMIDDAKAWMEEYTDEEYDRKLAWQDQLRSESQAGATAR